jgi:hypothetical protein
MTQEDIYEMISEAGMYVSNFDGFVGRVWCSEGYPIDEELFRLAALVAAHEREACIAIAENKRYSPNFVLASIPSQNGTAVDIANLIRARGEK